MWTDLLLVGVILESATSRDTRNQHRPTVRKVGILQVQHSLERKALAPDLKGTAINPVFPGAGGPQRLATAECLAESRGPAVYRRAGRVETSSARTRRTLQRC